VDGRIISDHSDIFNAAFLEFLLGFVRDSVSPVAAAAP
jgi:hypothetical protein